MSKADYRSSIELTNPPPLSAKQKAELDRIRKLKDEDIDLSDIPELDERFWKNAKHRPMYKVAKTSTTVRIDADVIAWLKSFGKGYQTRINAVLREAMLRDKLNKEAK